MTSCYIPQLSFSFYRHRTIRADFSGGQITSPTSTVFRVGGFVFYNLRFFFVTTCADLPGSVSRQRRLELVRQSSAGADSRPPSGQIVRWRGPLAVWTDSTRR
jgi:hypothetical protein